MIPILVSKKRDCPLVEKDCRRETIIVTNVTKIEYLIILLLPTHKFHNNEIPCSNDYVWFLCILGLSFLELVSFYIWLLWPIKNIDTLKNDGIIICVSLNIVIMCQLPLHFSYKVSLFGCRLENVTNLLQDMCLLYHVQQVRFWTEVHVTTWNMAWRQRCL